MAAIPPRKLLLHGAILLAILGLVLADPLHLGPPCRTCDGSGVFHEDPMEEIGLAWAESRPCPDCSGPRHRPTPEKMVRELVLLMVGGFWITLTLSVIAGLIWSYKVVDCRVCGGGGKVLLEVTSPGRREYTVRERCYGCGGRGRLTAVDRWVIGQGWEGNE